MIDLEIPLKSQKPKHYRFFEILPGVMSWTILALPAILAFINSDLAAFFVLLFIVTWFIRSAVMAVRVLQGYAKMNWRKDLDWQKVLDSLDNPALSIQQLEADQAISKTHRNWQIEALNNYLDDTNQAKIRVDELYHALVIAVANESNDIIEPTIDAIAESEYDLKKVMLVIAYEERGGVKVEKNVQHLVNKHRDKFALAQAIKHPADLPDEVIGKGANITFAAEKLVGIVHGSGIKPENVLLTTLDADNRVHKNYLSSIAFAYLTSLDRKHKSYQPIVVYLNNIWHVPAPARIIAISSSFFWAIQSLRPHLLRNFSSHAQSLDALIEANFWSKRTIVEDGHQFWRSYFAFDGNHEVVPTFVPISQDAVLAETYLKTLKAQFIQLRRWTYGASDIAYVYSQSFFKPNKISLWDRISKCLRQTETHISWATSSLVLAGAAWAPIYISPDGRNSIVAQQLPGIASALQSLALLGMPGMIYLSIKILPKKPDHYSKFKYVFMLLQWVLVPVTSIIYGSVASLTSQTRLMLGKYLDKFDITVKATKKV